MAVMMGLGMTEIIVVLVIALIVIGPDKLPGLAYKLGKGWGEFRRTFDEVKDGFTTDIKRSAAAAKQPPPPTARVVDENASDTQTDAASNPPSDETEDNTPASDKDNDPIG